MSEYEYNTSSQNTGANIDCSKTTAQGGESIQSFCNKVIARLVQIQGWFNGLKTDSVTQSSTQALTSGGAYTALAGKINSSAINAANGVAGLNSNAKVPYANLPVVGSIASNIIERGSNANGEYVKFADGTIICTSTQTQNVTFSISSITGLYTSPQIYKCPPASFIGTPVVTVSFYANYWEYVGLSSTFARVYTMGDFYFMLFELTAAGTYSTDISILWVGRWKQEE